MKLSLQNRFLVPTVLAVLVAMGVYLGVSTHITTGALKHEVLDAMEGTCGMTLHQVDGWVTNRDNEIRRWSADATLRTAPADDTTRNLLELLRCKLDLCARLGVFELEAGSEGHHAAARLFHDLGAVERDSFERLKRRLIAEMEASGTVAEPPMPTAGG